MDRDAVRTYIQFAREELSVDHPEEMTPEVARALVQALYETGRLRECVSDPSAVPGGPGSVVFRMAAKTFELAERCYEVLLEGDRCTIREVEHREQL